MRENLLITGPDSASLSIILAHGAGAAMDTPFMETISEDLAGQGYRVIRFEFPYMQAMREDGRRRPPNPQKALVESHRSPRAHANPVSNPERHSRKT